MTPRDAPKRGRTPTSARAAAALALALVAAFAGMAAHAASRARYGGTLKVAVAGKMAETEPLFADAPLEATLVSLVAQPLCRLDGLARLEPAVASELSAAVSPYALEVKLGQATRQDRQPLRAADAAQALRRALAEPTPYRGLLLPIADAAAVVATSDDHLRLRLAFPWPDLDRALCHPALALARAPRVDGAGPFAALPAQGAYGAHPAWPRGRPFVDALSVVAADARSAARQVAQRKVHLALGIAPADAAPPPLLSASYLLWSPEKAGPDVRAALEKAVSREDLTRFFVRAPSAPMTALLPPLLMPAPAAPAAPAAAPAGAQRSLALTFDGANEDHRAVAERLQVRLQSLGFRVALEPVARRALRERWKAGDFTLMLQQVLLPPLPAPALAVVMSLARKADTAARLKPLGAIADPKERAERTHALAVELLPQLELLPLYAQGLSLQAGPGVQQLGLDGFGLPRLDDVFLGEPP